MAASVAYLEYPIYSVGTDGEHIVTSGGGGGVEYGIEDQLGVHKFVENHITTLCSSGDIIEGVVDSIVYSAQAKLWACCWRSFCLLFTLDAETSTPVVLQRIRTDFTQPEGRLTVVRFAPSGELLVTGGDEKILRIWRLEVEVDRLSSVAANEAFGLVAELTGHTGEVKDCAISDDAQIVVSTASDCTLKVWDVKTGSLLSSQELFNPKDKKQKLIFRCCRFFGVSNKAVKCLLTVACGPRGPSFVVLWKLQFSIDGTAVRASKRAEKWIDKQPCCALTVTSDFSFFAVGFVSGTCKVFNRSLRLIKSHELHQLPITGIVFVDKNGATVSTGADYSIATMQIASTWKASCRSVCTSLCITLLLLFLLSALCYVLHDAASVGLQLLTRNTDTTYLQNHIEQWSRSAAPQSSPSNSAFSSSAPSPPPSTSVSSSFATTSDSIQRTAPHNEIARAKKGQTEGGGREGDEEAVGMGRRKGGSRGVGGGGGERDAQPSREADEKLHGVGNGGKKNVSLPKPKKRSKTAL